MKLTTLALAAAAGLLVTSFAYAEASKTLTADDTSALGGAAMSGAPASNPNNDMITQGNASGNLGAAPSADSSNANDDMSADTATGDDDY